MRLVLKHRLTGGVWNGHEFGRCGGYGRDPVFYKTMAGAKIARHGLERGNRAVMDNMLIADYDCMSHLELSNLADDRDRCIVALADALSKCAGRFGFTVPETPFDSVIARAYQCVRLQHGDGNGV